MTDDTELTAPLTDPTATHENAHHVCEKNIPGSWDIVRLWYLPPLHLLSSIAFWAFMTQVLPGKTFAIGRGGTDPGYVPPGRWYQSDATTAISIFLLVCRISAGVWQGSVVWRSFWLLLHKSAPTVSEIEFLSDWSMLALSNIRHYWRRAVVWMIGLVMLLAWPAQVVGPVATGAVSWIPSYAFDSANSAISPPVVGRAEIGDPWRWYLAYNTTRRYLVEESAGLANLESYLVSNDSGVTVPAARRPTLMFSETANGTSVNQMAVPLFDIRAFEWMQDASMLDPALQSAVLDVGSGFLNISQPSSPLGVVLVGAAAPLKSTQWTNTSFDPKQLPAARVFNGTKYAALLIKYDYSNATDPCVELPNTIFKALPIKSVLSYRHWNNYFSCYAVGKMDITAGTVDCRDYFHNGSLCSVSRSSRLAVVSYGEARVLSDSLVNQVFDMMPEVMSLMVTTSGFTNSRTVFSTAFAPLDPGIFLQNALKLGYQGTWAALTNRLTRDAGSAEYIVPTAVVVASVSATRMYIWLSLNLLLTGSSLLLAYLEQRAKTPVILSNVTKSKFNPFTPHVSKVDSFSPRAVAMFLDNSRILAHDRRGVCSATDLTQKKCSIGRLYLERRGKDDGFHHDILQVQRMD